jgi:signal transduction histidine kinase
VPLVEAALRVHRKGLEKKTIQLVKSLPNGLSAAVHSGEILQVISNLVANALDALPVGGTLCVRLR